MKNGRLVLVRRLQGSLESVGRDQLGVTGVIYSMNLKVLCL